MKPNWNGVHVVVDFHGVIADFAHAVIIRAGGPPPYQDEITQYGHPVFNGVQEKLSDPEWFYPVMPTIVHAQEALTGMMASGYYITIASDSPHTSREPVLNWLQAWKVPFDKYMDGADGIDLEAGKNCAGGHILVDDKPENIVKYARRVGAAILFGQPWNASWDSGPALTSYSILRRVGWQKTLEQIRRWSHVEGKVPYLGGR